jgi:hypothetical protein
LSMCNDGFQNFIFIDVYSTDFPFKRSAVSPAVTHIWRRASGLSCTVLQNALYVLCYWMLCTVLLDALYCTTGCLVLCYWMPCTVLLDALDCGPFDACCTVSQLTCYTLMLLHKGVFCNGFLPCIKKLLDFWMFFLMQTVPLVPILKFLTMQ